MSTVTLYAWNDASAPTLTGQAGSLTNLLDAVLINGYGSKSAAGWTTSYSGTNKRMYKIDATAGTGNILYIDDSNSTGVSNEAWVCGFETATGLGTGTGQFPTSAQMPLGPIGQMTVRKSATADSTVRKWWVLADNTVFYLFTETYDYSPVSYPENCCTFVFGDIFSYKANDPYRTIIIARNNTNVSGVNFEWFNTLHYANPNTSVTNYVMGGHYMPRSWTGLGSSIPVGKHIETLKFSGPSSGNANYYTNNIGTSQIPNDFSNCISIGSCINIISLTFPHGPDGGLYLSPIWIHHNGVVRGYLKGLWAPLHNRPLNHGDTYTGNGNLAGRNFMAIGLMSGNAGGNYVWGQLHIETSSTWS